MKLLTIDGGGIFGVGPAAVLQSLRSYDKIDAIAGTSIGAVVGAMVATGTPHGELLHKMQSLLPPVFAGHKWRHYMPITPRYNDKNLNKCLQAVCPGAFRDVKIPMFVAAADLDNKALKVYYSGDTEDGTLPLWEVLRRAVAAETYFLPWKGIGDGGIYANNPVMVAIAGVCDEFKVQPKDLEVLSIGTGTVTANTSVGSTKGWTFFRWGAYIISALLEGASSGMHEFFAARLDLARYRRMQFIREKDWAMDNPSDISAILKAWKHTIYSYGVEADKFFNE